MSDQDRLTEILAEYEAEQAAAAAAARSATESKRRQLLEANPDLADELQKHFTKGQAAGARATVAWGRPESDTGGDTPANVDATVAHVSDPSNRVPSFDDYELLEEVAKGGMGVVYKARQVGLDRIVALKMIRSGELAHEAEVERFHTEARAAAKLEHSGILPIYEIGERDGQHFFTMAFVEGGSLQDMLAEGPLPPRKAAELVQQIAEAIAHAHEQGIVHRDLKPANILVDKDGQPKVADFGLAKRLEDDSGLTASGAAMGTPSYMPPEQALGKGEDIGPLADVYSLGAVLYCLLTGRPPFAADNYLETIKQVLDKDPAAPRTLNPAIPKDLETICLKCLRKEQRSRYQTATELAEDLQRWLGSEPIKARRVKRLEKAWLWCKRRPAVASLIVALLLVTVGGAVLAYRAQKSTYSAGLVDRLLQADMDQVHSIIAEMDDGHRQWTDILLQKRLDSPDVKESERLRGSMALLSQDPNRTNYLLERLPTALPNETKAVRRVLAENDKQGQIADRVWDMLDEQPGAEAVLPLAAALAELAEQDDPKWEQVASQIAGALVGSDAVYLGGWLELLRPQKDILVPVLAAIYSDRSEGRSQAHREMATTVLRQYAEDAPHQLAELLLQSEPWGFRQLFPLAARPNNAAQISSILLAELDRQVTHDWLDPPLDQSWQQSSAKLASQLEGAHGMLAESFAYCQSLPWAEFENLAQQLKPAGYRPTRVRPYANTEGMRVAAVWKRDGGPWNLQPAVAANELPTPGRSATLDGMVPVDLAPYSSPGPSAARSPAVQFALLWGPAADGEQRRIAAGLSESQLAQLLEAMTAANFAAQATFQLLPGREGQRLYCGIWSNQGAVSTAVPPYGGWERLDQVHWDISQGPPTVADLLVEHERRLADFNRKSAGQLNRPKMRAVRAYARYGLGLLEPALQDLDFLIENDETSSVVLMYRTMCLARLGQRDEANESFKQFAAVVDAKNKAEMEVMVLAWLGEKEAAKARLERLASEGVGDADTLFGAARAAAQAGLPGAKADQAFSDAMRKRSLELLAAALEAGFRDADSLITDLAPLHSNPQFRRLLAQLAPAGNARFVTLLRADVRFESRLLSNLSLEEHATQSQQLAVQGYRPSSISIAVSAAGSPRAASVWRRPLPPEETKEELAIRQSNAAVALMQLGQAKRVWPLLVHSPDPRRRSYLIDRLASLGVDPATLLQRLKEEADVSARRALALSLGNYARAGLLDDEVEDGGALAAIRKDLVATLLNLYRDDPDPGLHGAAEWALRQLGQEDQLRKIRRTLATGKVKGSRNWYVTRTGRQTMVVLRPKGPVLMGSPISESKRSGGPTGNTELRHHRVLAGPFAIASHEVTVAQFRAFRQNHEFDRQYAREETAPANVIRWYDAAAFCNWLSQQEGLPPDQWCYDPQQPFENGMKLPDDHLQRTGYRLPTEAEWEYACRAGATTARYFGETPTLLDRYAWFTENSGDRWMLPVGSLKPNDFGLFDVFGNVFEWCTDPAWMYPNLRQNLSDVEWFSKSPSVSDNDRRVMRGGSFIRNASTMRAANRANQQPINEGSNSGFRVTRTYPLSP